MFLKNRILRALNNYEDRIDNRLLGDTNRSLGITRNGFYRYLITLRGNNNLSFPVITKIIDDCIDDGYINRQETTTGELVTALDRLGDPVTVEEKVEHIWLSSSGREFSKALFFWLKYMPQAFPKPTEILVTILISIITTLITIYLATN